MTMQDYETRCTPEQTRRAYALGAPLVTRNSNCRKKTVWCDDARGEVNKEVPTTQQMMGWLREEHNIHIKTECEGKCNYVGILEITDSNQDIEVLNPNYIGCFKPGYETEPLAELASIDASLDYLEKGGMK